MNRAELNIRRDEGNYFRRFFTIAQHAPTNRRRWLETVLACTALALRTDGTAAQRCAHTRSR